MKNFVFSGPSCIRSNQSAIRPRKQQQIEINRDSKKMFGKIQSHLIKTPYAIPMNSIIFKQYSDCLLNHYKQRYSTPLSYKDHIQAQEQANIARSILKKIRQHKLILRETDKSNHFYVGSINEFKNKVQKYFNDTKAFIELSSNPFNEILDKVIQLLNHLRSKELILQWQYNKMLPNRTKSELAHLYFKPKTHKVWLNILEEKTTKIYFFSTI